MQSAPYRHSVLIVEDERIFAKDLQQTLADMGYDAFAIAASADDAIVRASERCPDLVLMDIRIKGSRDGVDTAALLREQFGVPIVYLTAHADDATIERAKRTEPYGYLMKPVKSVELRSAIEVAIHRHAMDSRLRERERQSSTRLPLTTPPVAVDLAGAVTFMTSAAENLTGTMAAGLAHAISNPLAIVLGNASLALEQLRRSDGAALDIDDMIAAQEAIENAARRIGRIVSDLQASTQPPQPVRGIADVERTIAWALQFTAQELRPRARVEVDNRCAGATVDLDETRFSQVLVHLLVNAAQAVPAGRPDHHRVVLCVRRADNMIAVEVHDSGPGMSPERIARAFEPFFAVGPAGAIGPAGAPSTGAGLGLAICHGIVGAAGGRLEIDSKPGHGSVLRVLLPSARPLVTQELSPIAASGLVPAAHAPRARILMIDDEPMVLRTQARMLRSHDVVCVDSARAALELIDRGDAFDLIFSDLMMPGMSGMDLYEHLLHSHPEAAHRMVFLSGGAISARTRDFLAVVPNVALQKPVAAAELREFVLRSLAGAAPPRA